MTVVIALFVLGIIFDICIILHNRREEHIPFRSEWTLDEGVGTDEESLSAQICERYGKKHPVVLPDTIIVHPDIKEVVERYTSIEFDDYTMDYTRKDLLSGEETEACWKGFYCIGGDGGEITFYVRKSEQDEKVYAFDMECSKAPEPYASNIRRFIVMRYNEWIKNQGL